MSNKPIASNIINRLTVLAKAITGWQPEGVDNRELNQVLFQGVTDHIWGTLAQVTAGEADFYTDGSGNPLNASAAAVTINEDDKILIRHDVIQTANLLLDCGGAKFTLEMYGGVALNMGAFDLTIGGTADETAGSIEVIGTGTLTIEDANGFRVSHTAMTVVTLAGDSVINNAVLADNFAIDWEATDLEMSLPTVATVKTTATKIQLVSNENVIKIIPGLDHTLAMPGDLNTGTEKPSTNYEAYYSANVAGTVSGKLVPILTGTTTATNSGFLVDGGQTFLDDLVLRNSIVVNNTDGISTTCSIDASANNTFAVTDDIFTIGEEYTIYLVPTFDSGHIFFAKTGSAFNDAGNDFTSFKYNRDYRVLKIYTEEIGRGSISRTTWPNDDTVPQITEGTNIVTVTAFTPKSTTSKILIEFPIFIGENVNAGNHSGVALHADNQTDALRVQSSGNNVTSTGHQQDTFYITHKLDSWGLSARVFSIRVSGIETYNYQSDTSGRPNARFSAAASSSIFKITEYEE